MGKGIQCPKLDHPSKTEVDEYHTKYIEELKRVYYSNKDKYGGSETLEIF